MNKKGIIIYLVMKGQDEFVEKAKTYFQKSSYLLEVIEINDWQDELSFESKTGKALFHTIETIKQKNLSLKCYISGYSLAGLFSLYAMHELDLDGAISVSGSLWKEGWLDYLKEHPIYHNLFHMEYQTISNVQILYLHSLLIVLNLPIQLCPLIFTYLFNLSIYCEITFIFSCNFFALINSSIAFSFVYFFISSIHPVQYAISVFPLYIINLL